MINWSTIDKVYRKLLLTQFFTKGWGKPDTIKRIFEFGKILADRPKCLALVNEDYPIKILRNVEQSRYRIVEGTFISPFAHYLPDLVPNEVKMARFEMIVPIEWQSEDYRPVCIHLAGTGDHGFWRRRVFSAKPLIKEYGIGSLSLENPFYGCRKPKDQIRSALHNVSDLFVMGGSLMLESIVLLRWLEKNGYGPLGLSGVSMGGHMATLASTVWDKPIPLIPFLSWSSATPAFTSGAMSGAIPWDLLRTQYVSHSEYEQEIMRQLLKCPKTDSFRLGKDFALNFPESYKEIRDFLSKRHSNKAAHPEKPHSSHHHLRHDHHPQQGTGDQSETEHRERRSIFQESDKDEPSTHESGHKNSAESGSTCNYPHQTTDCESCPWCNGNSELCHRPVTESVSPTSEGMVPPKKAHRHHHRPEVNHPGHSKNRQRNVNLRVEAYQFMRGVMDVTTFIGNFSVPVDTQMVISVLATQDAYIPRDSVPGLNTIWPGIEMRYVSGSHVTAALFKQHHFRQAINDAFQKYRRKYPPGKAETP